MSTRSDDSAQRARRFAQAQRELEEIQRADAWLPVARLIFDVAIVALVCATAIAILNHLAGRALI